MTAKRKRMNLEALRDIEADLLERLTRGEQVPDGAQYFTSNPDFIERLEAKKREARSHNKQIAKHVLKPMGLASLAIAKILESAAPGLTQELLQEELPTSLEKFKTGGTAQVEEMLASQSLVLQALSNSLMAQAATTPDFNRQQTILQSAIKTSNQLRLVLATLAEIQNPRRAIFVRKQLNQMNFSENSKQLGGATNKLLGGTLNNGASLDERTERETTPSYSEMEALDSFNGSDNP